MRVRGLNALPICLFTHGSLVVLDLFEIPSFRALTRHQRANISLFAGARDSNVPASPSIPLLLPIEDLSCDFLGQSIDGAKWTRSQYSFLKVGGRSLKARFSSGCWLDMSRDSRNA